MSCLLASCPFCGGTPTGPFKTEQGYCVGCMLCSGRMYGTSSPGAIANWNARHTPQVLAQVAWEYRVLELHEGGSGLTKTLLSYGSVGWELSGVIPRSIDTGDCNCWTATLIFKRRVQDA